jgi:hypothetical protein
MPRLSDTQLEILATAARRDDGAALPLPDALKIQGGAATGVLKSLIAKGLLEEQPAAGGATAWREAKDGQRLMLIVTAAGRQAVGIEPAQDANKRPVVTKSQPSKRRQGGRRTKPDPKPKTKAASSSTRPGTKQSLLVDLLSRRKGASIAEAVKATRWQPHSVRGAISGTLKKKLGLIVASEKVDGRGRVYRIVTGR